MGRRAWTDRGALRSSVCVAAVRAARSSPAATLSEAAAAGGCTYVQMVAALRNLPARGRCAQLAAGSVTPAGPAVSRFAAPPTKRTAAGELPADANMAGSASWAGRSALHAGAPRRLLTRLAGDEDPELRRVSASEDLLSKLADDSERSVLCAVAQNRSTPADVLRRLAETPYRDVRVAVACNPVCGPAVVEQLAKDSADMVRKVAASHPSCPATALKRLRDDIHFPTTAANARRALTLRCL